MLKKRIIPCLDIKEGRVVKGVRFESLRDAGSPVEVAEYYSANGADELVFLDITAGINDVPNAANLAREIGKRINIPFTVGGGLKNIEDIARVLDAGADKVAINSAAVERPTLISETAERFGSQCVVVAIDYVGRGDETLIATKSGTKLTECHLFDFLKIAEAAGAGEFLLTSKHSDGTKAGFDVNTLAEVAKITSRPIIASGGAGSKEDFRELFFKTDVSAGLAASIFHFKEIEINQLKEYLLKNNIEVSK
jgi:imidazole glycerol-phosphate synthase subunit HisF